MSEKGKDVLGQPLTESEAKLLAVYEDLKALLDEKDLAPTTHANVAEAVASLWQAVNNLGLTDDRPEI